MMSIDSATDFTLLSCFCFCDFLYRSSINCLLFGFIGFNLLLKISHPLFEYKRTHTSTPLFNKQYSKITWAKWYQNVVKSFWYGLNAARDNGGGSGANWNSNMHKAPRPITTTRIPRLFLTGRMSFLPPPPNQQCQSTKGKVQTQTLCEYIFNINILVVYGRCLLQTRNRDLVIEKRK